jgi:uncharacterized Zn-binding protein involved in type VI secretion
MKRHLILNGVKTIANEAVVVAPTTVQFGGHEIAHEGGDVQCPASDTTCKIRATRAKPEMFKV